MTYLVLLVVACEVTLMTFHYPNGKRYTIESSPLSASNYKPKEKNWTYGKRGMTFEEDINETNQYYLIKASLLSIKNRLLFKLLMLTILKEVQLSLRRPISNRLLQQITMVYTKVDILILKQKKPNNSLHFH